LITAARCSALLLIVAVLGPVGCESLRPVAPKDEWSKPSPALQRAKKLLAENAPLNYVANALQLALDEAGDPRERNQIRQLRALIHLRWFQLAHIADRLLVEVQGHDRVFTSLVKDLRSPAAVTKLPEYRSRKSKQKTIALLDFLAPLIDKSAISVTKVEARRALVKELSQLSRRGVKSSRDFAHQGRRFLTLDAGWHYNKSPVGAQKRIAEWLDYLKRYPRSPMAGHAWLAMRLTLAHLLKTARIPSQSLLMAIGELLKQPQLSRKKTPMQLLLELGKGEGETLPERLYVAWHGLRTAVEFRMNDYRPSDGSSAVFVWSRLSAFLELYGDAGRPAADDLHTLGDAVRSNAVSEWLVKNALPGPGHEQILTSFSDLMVKNLDKSGLDDPQWVMAVLTFQEIVAARLPEVAGGSVVRLTRSGSFETRALRLPNARQINHFPDLIKHCIEGSRPKVCFKSLLARSLSLAKQAR
jgi:hypothetical protein